MKSNYIEYDFEKSRERLDEILNASNDSFEEIDYIPSRDQLTYANGYYVNCTALFIDIRDSSRLPAIHTRPVLAKIYRAYISELVAIMNGNNNCREINIYGDSVWGVFETPKKVDVDSVFNVAYTSASMVDILNFKLSKKGFKEITIGIGIDDGRALMIKSGYFGSGINEIVWMGDVVNQASKLCNFGNKGFLNKEIMVSRVIYNNLNDHNKGLLIWNNDTGCFHGNVVNTNMNYWLNNEKNK